MRQVVLDTETTGLTATEGHRIIEIGCVELINRRHTGRHLHHYLDPERDVDAAAVAVHGLSRERLKDAPKFGQVAAALLEFISGAELIIHNAEFDITFLDMELALLASSHASVRSLCRVLDTLAMARERHPGQRNSLDALCKRYGVDNARRELHGALLDAQLLADVYLAMTGGQSLLALEDAGRERDALGETTSGAELIRIERPEGTLCIVQATPAELAAHAELTVLLQQASGGRCLWLAEPALPPAA